MAILESLTAEAMWTSFLVGGRWVTGNRIEITSPREREVALSERREESGPHAYRVRGRLKRKPAMADVWLLVEDESTGCVWPQVRAEYDKVTREWSGLVWDLRKPSAKIVAVVAPRTSDDFFSYYSKHARTTDWASISRLPSEITNSAFVRVKIV